MKIKILFPFIYFLLAFSNKLPAQGENNFWFFGQNAGVDFNSGAPIAITVGALNTIEGCASISNAAGNLLFYTDGVTVWNKLHTPMPNGVELHGDESSTQSAIIVPKPGNANIYYIFTTDAWGDSGGLCYSEVNMTLNGGLGDVTAIKNILLYTPVTEKLTAIKNSNNTDFWVLAHTTTDSLLVYAVTCSGVVTTPVVSIGGTLDPWLDGIGYMKPSADGRKIVLGWNDITAVDVVNFNTTTGAASFDFSFTVPDSFAAHPYGVEFSPDGTRLYVSSYNNIFQYDMSLGSSAAIIESVKLVGTASSPSMFAAIQNGPDGKMYITKPVGSALSCITYPNALGLACGFIDSAVYLEGRLSGFGLTNFVTMTSGIALSVNDSAVAATCAVPGSASVVATGGAGFYTITWNTSPVQYGPNATNLPAGSYTATITDISCPPNEIIDSVTVNLLPGPVALFTMSPTETSVANTLITFTDQSTGTNNVTWNFGDPASGPSDTSVLSSPAHSYSEPGKYCIKMMVSNMEGCTDTLSKCIEIINGKIEIPNVFTPNGDSQNDVFYIKNLQPGIADLKIYNRWGNLIYSSPGYNNDWDGNENSDGTYYYIMNYPMDEKIHTGFVQLIKANN